MLVVVFVIKFYGIFIQAILNICIKEGLGVDLDLPTYQIHSKMH